MYILSQLEFPASFPTFISALKRMSVANRTAHKSGRPTVVAIHRSFLPQWTRWHSNECSSLARVFGGLSTHMVSHEHLTRITPPHTEVDGQLRISPTEASFPFPISPVSGLLCLLYLAWRPFLFPYEKSSYVFSSNSSKILFFTIRHLIHTSLICKWCEKRAELYFSHTKSHLPPY